MADQKHFLVKSTLDRNRVALWERDTKHPAGDDGQHEVFIAGDKAVLVGMSAAVRAHLNSGELVRVEGAQAAPEPPAPPKSDESEGDEPKPQAAPKPAANAKK